MPYLQTLKSNPWIQILEMFYVILPLIILWKNNPEIYRHTSLAKQLTSYISFLKITVD